MFVGDVAVVTAVGDVDLLTAPRLKNAAEFVIGRGPAALVVDLTNVRLLASAGMQVLVDAQDMLGSSAAFAVVADGPGTSRPLEVIGLTDALTVVPTLDEALATVRGAAPSTVKAPQPDQPDSSFELYRHFYPKTQPPPPDDYVGRHRTTE